MRTYLSEWSPAVVAARNELCACAVSVRPRASCAMRYCGSFEGSAGARGFVRGFAAS